MNNNTDSRQLPLEERIEAMIASLSLEEKVSQLTNSSAAVEHAGIKKYDWWNEALHGVARAGKATVFPQAIGLAACWNDELLFKVASAISTEARAKYNDAQKKGNYDRYYGLTFWSPNINIFRDPRWGRGHETYGEDPYLTSRLAVAFIKGLQGNTAHLKAAACAKHFAAHSGPEKGRFDFDARVSKKDMAETYLPAFEACVRQANVEAVMGAYNALNGVPCTCSSYLLTHLLRGKWGFDGHVVSDCGAIRNIAEHHGYVPDLAGAAAAGIKNGCDLNCGDVYAHLTEAYERDLVTMDEIDNALRRTLKTRFKLGMFDGRTEYDSLPMSAVACEQHKELCRQAARESLVLLKNDGLLPLDASKISSLAVIGPNSDSLDVLLGNYNGTPTEYTTVYKGFCELLGESRVSLAKGCDIYGDDDEQLLEKAVRSASSSDAVVLCLGLDATSEGEDGDGGDRQSIEMTAPQLTLLKRICEVNGNVIVVMMCGGAVAMTLADEKARAIINAWYPGEYGGAAIAQLVFGEYSPSGRLPVTFYRSTEDLPDFADYSMKNRTYRYFEGEALYPFGFGLSYTDFELAYSVCIVSGVKCRVAVRIKNIGNYSSYEVLKLFLAEKNAANQPIRRLARFKKVFVPVGETIKTEFELDSADFTHINDEGIRESLPVHRFDITVEG